MAHAVHHPTVTVVKVQSPGGNSLSVLPISHGALAWGGLPGGGQIRITATSNTAEMPDLGGILGGLLDALVDIALKLKKVLGGCTPLTTVHQEFKDGKLVSQDITQTCAPS